MTLVKKFILGNLRRGGFCTLAAAILFGASTPAAKAIIPRIHPLMLAGLLYMGSGFGLAIIRIIGRRDGLRLIRKDMPWLSATVVFGGILARLC